MTGPTLIARKGDQSLEILAPGHIPEIDAVLTATHDNPT
jgi:hypothetical protein